MSQSVPAAYILDPDDPRAPTREQWCALGEDERRRVVDALPTHLPIELHPPEGDVHRKAKYGALGTLDDFFRRAGRRIYFSSELIVYYPGERTFIPDLLAVADVESHDRMRWVVDVEGKGIDLILEVLVAGSPRKDLEKNVERYARLGIREYVVFDRGACRLHVYRLAEGRAYRKAVPQGGRYASSVLGLDLALDGDRLRFFLGTAPLEDAPDTIARLGGMLDKIIAREEEAVVTLAREVARAEAAEKIASDERTRADEAERRLADALAELERLRDRLVVSWHAACDTCRAPAASGDKPPGAGPDVTCARVRQTRAPRPDDHESLKEEAPPCLRLRGQRLAARRSLRVRWRDGPPGDNPESAPGCVRRGRRGRGRIGWGSRRKTERLPSVQARGWHCLRRERLLRELLHRRVLPFDHAVRQGHVARAAGELQPPAASVSGDDARRRRQLSHRWLGQHGVSFDRGRLRRHARVHRDVEETKRFMRAVSKRDADRERAVPQGRSRLQLLRGLSPLHVQRPPLVCILGARRARRVRRVRRRRRWCGRVAQRRCRGCGRLGACDRAVPDERPGGGQRLLRG